MANVCNKDRLVDVATLYLANFASVSLLNLRSRTYFPNKTYDVPRVTYNINHTFVNVSDDDEVKEVLYRVTEHMTGWGYRSLISELRVVLVQSA